MDEYRYMILTQTMTRIPSYRDVLRALAAVGVDLGLDLGSLWSTEDGESRHRRRRRRAGAPSRAGSGAVVCTVNQDCLSGCGCSNCDTEGVDHGIGDPCRPSPVPCMTDDDP